MTEQAVLEQAVIEEKAQVNGPVIEPAEDEAGRLPIRGRPAEKDLAHIRSAPIALIPYRAPE